jgi:hypothetical protein
MAGTRYSSCKRGTLVATAVATLGGVDVAVIKEARHPLLGHRQTLACADLVYPGGDTWNPAMCSRVDRERKQVFEAQ